MNSPLQAATVSSSPTSPAVVADSASVLQREVAIMSGRIADLLRQRFADDTSVIAVSLAFLEFRYRERCGDTPLSHWQGHCISRWAENKQSHCYRLISTLGLQNIEVELLLLGGLADDHEGFADIFRTLHPAAQPLPTLGLAAQLFCADATQRQPLRYAVEAGVASKFGIYVTDEESPFYARGLRLPDQLWSVLQGVDSWPKKIPLSQPQPVKAGLSEWFKQPEVCRAQQHLKSKSPCSVLVLAENAEIATHRASALCAHSELPTVLVEQANLLDGKTLRLLQLHCLARGLVPLLSIGRSGNPENENSKFCFDDYPLPVIVCAEFGAAIVDEQRPLISLHIEPLNAQCLRQMWQQLLPELADQAQQLAARYPFEPALAKNICQDLRYLYADRNDQIKLSALAEAVRARSTTLLSGGVQLIRPVSGWSQLILQEAQLAQMKDASKRLFLQSQVLDDWQFLKGRRGARGVRMLFSGPSGTGKTLSAEVIAKALNVDLLLVDLSRVVSKWIGETEKNLADIFLTAESSKAVLFFDEADALFGKRTEVSDAHDRYANLETAYLLSRLERYDGLAILATNYRQNIDAAFSRRLEFIVEFVEPGYDERLKLWQCHIPAEAPLDADVNLEELASLFPIVGGYIRNASVAAAFFAAQENSNIKRRHFVEAIRREYEKSGKAFREILTR